MWNSATLRGLFYTQSRYWNAANKFNLLQNVPLLTFSAFCCPCLDFFDVCCYLQIQNQFLFSQLKSLILFLCSIVNKIWVYMIRVSPPLKTHVLFSDLFSYLTLPLFPCSSFCWAATSKQGSTEGNGWTGHCAGVAGSTGTQNLKKLSCSLQMC